MANNVSRSRFVAATVAALCLCSCRGERVSEDSQPFCSATDIACSDNMGFGLSKDMTARYLPGAKGAPYRELFEFAQELSTKGEFETSQETSRRVSALPQLMNERFGEAFAVSSQSVFPGYDADSETLDFAGARTNVIDLMLHRDSNRTTQYALQTQGCKAVTEFKLARGDAPSMVKALRAGELVVFFVGKMDFDRKRLPRGFEQTAPGFLSESYWANGRYWSSLRLLFDLHHMDIVNSNTGSVVKTVSC